MTTPSLRRLALGEIAGVEDVQRLLREDESLFVEQKSDIAKGAGYQLAKAAASFANTLGGWILVGAKDGKPLADWSPPRAGFVDTVRQRLEGEIDPLPSFAARVVEYRGGQIGLVRVYESADTPHILVSDGAVVVREPAQDAKLRKLGRYEAISIRSHFELVELAHRGNVARAEAEARLAPGARPLIEDALGLRWTTAAGAQGAFRTVSTSVPALIVRLAPLTTSGRWADWAVTESTTGSLAAAARALLPSQGSPRVLPYASGMAVRTKRTEPEQWTRGASIQVSSSATVALDAGGVIGAALDYQRHQSGGLANYWRELDEGAGPRALLEPVLEGLVQVLAAAEQLGRYAAHLYWLRMGELFRVDPQNPDGHGTLPGDLPVAGELTIDGTPDDEERSDLARRWAEELARASGVGVWRPRGLPTARGYEATEQCRFSRPNEHLRGHAEDAAAPDESGYS